MAFIYLTEEVKEKAERHGISEQIENLIEDFESMGFDDAVNLFEVRYPYRYKRIGNYRLVASVKRIEEHQVLCVLDMLIRGSREAERFNLDHESYGVENFDPFLIEEDVVNFLQKQTHVVAQAQKEDLPEEIKTWWLPFQYIDSDLMILESDDWITAFENVNFNRHWAAYHQLVKDIIEQSKHNQTESKDILSIENKDGRGIFYIYFHSIHSNVSQTSKSVLFLVAPFQNELTQDESYFNRLRGRYEWITSKAANCDFDELAQNSRRAYPSYTLDDDNLWAEIETERASNMAMSGEELNLLSQLRHDTGKDNILPVFINGRAGSGKSTILYYLFSDYLFRKVHDEALGELLFITYSKELLTTAQNSVKRLIRIRPELRMESATSGKNVDFGLVKYEKYFKPFLDHLIELAQENLSKSYDLDKHIDYRRFLQLFQGRNLPKELENFKPRIPLFNIAPDLSWHVIRTFIKGYRAQNYLSPSDYQEIHAKEKSIDQTLYEEIYENVWQKWYLPLHEEEGFWDTLDLVRELLNNQVAEPNYSVIFCDEAQDFTRIELDFILSLLIYRGYDLGWEKNIRLPFALAGDPFQTLNPTGFRWDAIKASFYDEISSNLDPENRELVDIHYEELGFNYRSTAPIVKFSNLIQLWRKMLFDNKEIVPQKPWKQENIIPPRLYTIGNNISEKDFADLIQNNVVILPCEKNQEAEFINADSELSKLKAESILFFEQSPIMAKGQEFPTVILYKFGEHIPERFFNFEHTDNLLEKEYFLNKLYVGVTRAKQNLIIIDTVRGQQNLWDMALEKDQIKKCLEKMDNPEIWDELTQELTPGEYYKPGDMGQDPKELAEMLRLGAKDSKNPDLLRQAKDFYQREGENIMAKTCQAEIYELEEKYEQAGDLFASLKSFDECERCYWKGSVWAKLHNLYKNFNPTKSIYQFTTDLMVDRDQKNAVHLITELLERIKQGELILFSERQYIDGIELALDLLLNKGIVEVSVYSIMLDLLQSAKVLNNLVDPSLLAILYYKNNLYEEAVSFWESLSTHDLPEYYQAKVQTTQDIEEKIELLSNIERYDEIVELYEQNPKHKYTPASVALISDALKRCGKHLERLNLLIQSNLSEEAVKLVKESIAHDPPLIKLSMLGNALVKLLRNSFTNNDLGMTWKIYENAGSALPKEDMLLATRYLLYRLGKFKSWKYGITYSIDPAFSIHGIPSRKIKWPHKLLPLDYAQLQNAFIQGFIENHSRLNHEEKNILERYFVSQVTKYREWKEKISPKTLCAFIEKFAQDGKILSFYESQMNERSLKPDEQLFLRKRWLKIKQRLLDNAIKNNDEIVIGKYERELKTRLLEWGLNKEVIESEPELPDYVRFNENEIFNDQSEIEITFKAPNCQIFNQTGKEAVIINISEGSFASLETIVDKKELDGRIQFTIPEWNVEGEIKKNKLAKIFANGESFEFTL